MRWCAVVLLFGVTLVLAHEFANFEHARKILLQAGSIDTLTSLQYYQDTRHERAIRRDGPQAKQQYLVHVMPGVHHEYRQNLEESLGVNLRTYIPHNTFLLYARPDVAERAASMKGVLWVGVYAAEYKVAPEISQSKRFFIKGFHFEI
jgi:hypothetical protein